MLALSTGWKAGTADLAETLVKSLQDLKITALELDFRISQAVFHRLKTTLQRAELTVASVHNYCPVPPGLPPAHAGGDLFMLSAPDREHRRQAVAWTTRTVENASELGAAAVVLHCGRVDMDPELQQLAGYWETGEIQSEAARAFVARKLEERDRLKPPHLDSLLFSLDRLLEAAQRYGVRLGLENRYHYHELPTAADFDALFTEFSGAPLGYWHDTGHAHVNETIGTIPPEALLPALADHLIGVHLSDARGREDHLPPGRGEIDFDRVKTLLKDDTLRVVELLPGTADTAVAEGLAFLHEKGID
jgi:sugar phosphate isomerase/epimerase